MLEQLVNWFVFSVFGLDQGSYFTSALQFFIYETVKIFILLSVIIFAISFLRSFVPQHKIRTYLAGKNEFVGNILAALFGIVTPFCSCSAVPLFIGFIEAGIPLGVTFSFLVASPMVNEIALAMLWAMLGWKIALIYIVSGECIAIIAGIVIGKLRLEHYVQDYVYSIQIKQVEFAEETSLLKDRLLESKFYTTNLLKKVGLYVLIGISIGAFIHGYAPENFLAMYAGKGNFWAVPLVVLIGVPLYSNAAGTIPIVRSLLEKGLPLGTSLAFMMSVTALSFPEIIILKQVLKNRLLGVFVGIVAFGILLTGYLFNFIL